MYAHLQSYVKAPEFLAKLVAARQESSKAQTPAASPPDADVRQPEWWQSPADSAEASTPAGADDVDDEAAADGFAQVRCLNVTVLKLDHDQ